MKKITFLLAIIFSAGLGSISAQYKSFQISVKGDTLNALRNDGKKVGKWINRIEELRGEPGYEEEGEYDNNGVKHGYWRKYSLQGDVLAIENYFHGGKDGLQNYYAPGGTLLTQESWRAYNPNAPYDTIDVYGTGSNEIISRKVVKAATYSVKHGDWKFYDPQTGMLNRTVKYELNNEVKPKQDVAKAEDPTKKREVKKTAQMLEWEKKNRGKKGAIRDGAVGL